MILINQSSGYIYRKHKRKGAILVLCVLLVFLAGSCGNNGVYHWLGAQDPSVQLLEAFTQVLGEDATRFGKMEEPGATIQL